MSKLTKPYRNCQPSPACHRPPPSLTADHDILYSHHYYRSHYHCMCTCPTMPKPTSNTAPPLVRTWACCTIATNCTYSWNRNDSRVVCASRIQRDERLVCRRMFVFFPGGRLYQLNIIAVAVIWLIIRWFVVWSLAWWFRTPLSRSMSGLLCQFLL